MKKSNRKSLVILFILLGFGTYLNAQVSVPTNGVPGTAASYVGWNVTRPFPLTISHKGNFPINIETNGIQRMHINQNRNAAIGGILGGFNVVTDGYVGIGPNTGNIWTTKGPFSLLHLNGGQVGSLGSVQEFGFRPWMHTGVTFTGNNDLMYFGIRRLATGQV